MVKIISDTLTCISPEEARQIGLGFVPQLVIFGNDSYRDDTEITPREFIRRLKASSSLPKTAAPPPAFYTPLYKEYSEQGETIIVVCPTAEASGTFRGASVAAQDFPNADIRVVDNHLLAGGHGAVAKAALQWANQGLDADTIISKIEEMSTRNRTYFLVDTLEYLYKGGRIGAARALMGSLLQMKPILTFRNGHTEPFESQRTHRRAMARLKEVVLSDCPRAPEANLCIMQGDAEEEACALAAEFAILLDIPLSSIPIYEMTPAILVHAGPGVIGVSYFVA